MKFFFQLETAIYKEKTLLIALISIKLFFYLIKIKLKKGTVNSTK